MEHYFTNNRNLKSELRAIKYKYKEYDFIFYSDNGVFSKDKIDYGSRLLLETILENTSEKNLQVLDVGCGYGFLGICLAKILDFRVTMCDINKRAIHLTEKNIIQNKTESTAIVSNIYENIKGKYDLVVSNPPIRAGKDVVYEILDNATDHLKKDGNLWFVMRKDHGVKSCLKHLESKYICEIIKKSKGFYIIKAKKH